jgi:hypothetical protein
MGVLAIAMEEVVPAAVSSVKRVEQDRWFFFAGKSMLRACLWRCGDIVAGDAQSETIRLSSSPLHEWRAAYASEYR